MKKMIALGMAAAMMCMSLTACSVSTSSKTETTAAAETTAQTQPQRQRKTQRAPQRQPAISLQLLIIRQSTITMIIPYGAAEQPIHGQKAGQILLEGIFRTGRSRDSHPGGASGSIGRATLRKRSQPSDRLHTSCVCESRWEPTDHESILRLRIR